jgi:DNA polymerase III epsilon subunit-like protein
VKKILYFDYETGSFAKKQTEDGKWIQPGQTRAVQIGCILVVNRRVLAEVNLLVRSGIDPVPEAFEIHGINRAMCEEYGVMPSAAHEVFRQLVMQADLCVSHNYEFDFKISEIENEYCGYNPLMDRSKSFCTMEALTPVLKLPKARGTGYKWPKLTEAYEYFFKEPFDSAHDAMADVRALRRVHERMLDLGIHKLS